MTDLSVKIDQLLKEADECEMLGGLCASHEERIANRRRAEELRALASETQHVLAERNRHEGTQTRCLQNS